MTGAGHTPGPWAISAEEPHRLTIVRPWDQTVRPALEAVFGDYRGAIVAHLEYIGGESVPTREKAEANARLIAAAPDLLEAAKDALEELLAHRGDETAETLSLYIGEAQARLHAAIEKAVQR